MIWAYLLMAVLTLVGFLLMFIILLQRGRGGGLAGAFGGLGGQSAFGTKAGDVFTRITIALAVVWVGLAAGSGFVLRWASEESSIFEGHQAAPESPVLNAGDEEEDDAGEGGNGGSDGADGDAGDSAGAVPGGSDESNQDSGGDAGTNADKGAGDDANSQESSSPDNSEASDENTNE